MIDRVTLIVMLAAAFFAADLRAQGTPPLTSQTENPRKISYLVTITDHGQKIGEGAIVGRTSAPLFYNAVFAPDKVSDCDTAYATRGDSDETHFMNRHSSSPAFHGALLASSQIEIYPTVNAAGEIKTLVDGSIFSRDVEQVVDTGRCKITTGHSLYGQVVGALDLAVGEGKTLRLDNEHTVTIKLISVDSN